MILPRLAALAILQAGGRFPYGRKQGRARVRPPAQTADQIEQLRATGVSLIHDPATKTLRTDGAHAIPVTVGLHLKPRASQKGDQSPARAPATAKDRPG